MTKFKHGSMEIETQEKTFFGFVKFVAWSVILILVFLVLLAMVNG